MRLLRYPIALVIAQASAPPPADWTTILYNTGIVGFFMALILIGRLWPSSSVEEIKKQRDLALQLAEMERQRADKGDDTIRGFASQGELITKVLTAIQELAKGDRR
jgi:hypothetical protein